VRPLRRREYDRLVELGLFEDERLELLRGTLVAMSPQGPPHADVVERLATRLVTGLAGRARVRSHSPLAVSDDSEPEPDIAVVPDGDYSTEHPSHALLVVEVADSSLRKDRQMKADLYAEAAVPDYWIVNLNQSAIEVHRDPSDGHYAAVTTYRRGQTLRLAAFPDIELEVDDILGPRA
jgi:Uma2 family endonuclease